MKCQICGHEENACRLFKYVVRHYSHARCLLLKNGATTFDCLSLMNYWVLGHTPFPEAHFATFPPEIPKRAILAGTSQKGYCPRCGAQWERVVVDKPESRVSTSSSLYPEGSTARRLALLRQAARKNGREYQYKIHADRWWPGCRCRQTQTMPSVVLDPFVGSGTTARVAEELGRRWIGIDLGYHDISRRRVAGATPALSLV